MKKLLFACMLFLHAFSLYSDDQKQSFPKDIKVLLEEEVDEILLEANGPYYIFNPENGSRITSGLLGKRFIVRATQNGIKWGEEFPGVYQIKVVPRSKENNLLIGGIQYEGAVIIYAVGSKINVVNELPIENYVKCLLSPKFLFPLENEVMSAIAILARTDAYYEASKGGNAFWHVDAKDVGYIGCALNRPNSLFEKVVEQTKNLILVYSTQGEPHTFPAKWTDHSAGKTASFTSIFRKDIDFASNSVDAPHAALDREDSRWHYTVSKSTLMQKLHLQEIKSVEHFMDKATNKTYAVRIHQGQGYTDLPFFELQNKLGENHLQSNDFKTELKGDSIVFSGFGKGHGVGLCLYSASAMAQNGDNAVKILTKFFPETYLYNLTAYKK